MKENSFRFQGKYIIEADLVCKTGLHIGGIQEGLEIGGIASPVIKDPLTGIPYIPGSSLKGKMRSLLEWSISCGDSCKSCVERALDQKIKEKEEELSNQNKSEAEIKEEIAKMEKGVEPCKCGKCDVCVIFGSPAEVLGEGPTRLTVRDIFPNDKTIEEWKKNLGEQSYTEFKNENVIDRITSVANPRIMERVPKGSIFKVEMIYDIYQKTDKERLVNIFKAMALLEDSSLGGSGTRGYGRIKFENIIIKKRERKYYTEKRGEKVIKKTGGKEILKIDEEKKEVSPAKYLASEFNIKEWDKDASQ